MIVWIVAVFSVAILSGYNTVSWTQGTITLALLGSGALFTAFLLTNLLWLFSERKRGLFQFVFLGLWSSAVMLAILSARRENYEHSLALVQSIEDARLALRQQAVERTKRTREDFAAEQERVRNDPFLQYRNQVSEGTLAAMRAVQESVLDELKEARERYETALVENEVDGPEAWLRVKTLDELEARRVRHENIYAASRAYAAFFDGLRERYVQRLEAAAFTSPADRFSVAEMERLMQFLENGGAAEIRRLDAEITTLALRAVDLLLDTWGEWRFDRRASRVVFENPSVEFQFMQILSQAQMLAQAQRKEERRLNERRP